MLSLWAALHSRLIADERGVTVTEYALLAALMAIVAMAVAVFIGDALGQRLNG